MPKRARSTSTTSTPAKRVCVSPPRRDDSVAPAGCPLPLTLQNVAALSGSPLHAWTCSGTLSVSSASLSERVSMPPRSSSPQRKNWDETTKLAAFNVKVDADQPYPQELQDFVNEVLSAEIAGVRSPNAHHIRDQRKTAALQNEPGANRILKPWLLFEGASPSALCPTPKIAEQANLNLAREFLPPSPSDIVDKEYGALSQPQPDTVIGYLTPTEAEASVPPLATAFSSDEALKMRRYTLNPSLLFPFLTCQWKPAAGESHRIAMCQTARDGTVVVNYLHDYYNTAYGRPASAVEALHLSVTCNVEMVNIWLHWREDGASSTPTHYMRSIHACTTWDADPLLKSRAILKNWLAYALGTRLSSIKDALPSFYDEYQSKAVKPAPKSSRPASTRSTSSIQPSELFAAPRQTGQTSPPRKRQRVTDEAYASGSC